MDRNELGQVIDPEALDASAGARGRLRVEVPAAWMNEGSAIEVAVPARILCDRCDGGGCDGCGRSGALRAPDDPRGRAVRLQVPAGSGGGVAVRIVRPFGDEAAIEQLIVEVRAGASPSPGVVRRSPALANTNTNRITKISQSSVAFRVALALAVVLAVAAAIASR
ncbi:MAG TPA: hypothetical protein VE093_13110 [Polyangiaceae bacterium]|nr:hypothetical protein [Polyangiaceae bacterium]